MHGLDVETPQDDALEQQLAQMEAHLQHIYGVNEDLQEHSVDICRLPHQNVQGSGARRAGNKIACLLK